MRERGRQNRRMCDPRDPNKKNQIYGAETWSTTWSTFWPNLKINFLELVSLFSKPSL